MVLVLKKTQALLKAGCLIHIHLNASYNLSRYSLHQSVSRKAQGAEMLLSLLLLMVDDAVSFNKSSPLFVFSFCYFRSSSHCSMTIDQQQSGDDYTLQRLSAVADD